MTSHWPTLRETPSKYECLKNVPFLVGLKTPLSVT